MIIIIKTQGKKTYAQLNFPSGIITRTCTHSTSMRASGSACSPDTVGMAYKLLALFIRFLNYFLSERKLY